MFKVFKYKLEIADHQTISLPQNSRILSVANQNEEVVLYAMVNTDEVQMKSIDIYMHGTGHEVANYADLFLGTVMLLNGNMVVHVFADSYQFYYNDSVCIKKVI